MINPNNNRWKTISNDDNTYRFNTAIDNLAYKNHPIVIFYDEYLQQVYFLTMKSYKSHHDLLIKQNLYVKLDVDPNFKINYKPSVIDTTTIYKMEYNEFVNTFKIQPQKLLLKDYFLKLDISQQKQILYMMLENVENDRICLKELSNNLSTTLYTSKKWIKKELYNQYINSDINLLKQKLNDVDNNHLIYSIHQYIDPNQMQLSHINNVRLTIMDAVIDWNQRNKFHNYHPQYLDISFYQKRWFKPPTPNKTP